MLPSQTGRPASSKSHMYRRPRRKRLPLLIALLMFGLVIIVGVRWWGNSKKAASAEGRGATPVLNPSVAKVDPKSEVKPAPPKSVTQAPPAKPKQDSAGSSIPPAMPHQSTLPTTVASSRAAEKITMGGSTAPKITPPPLAATLTNMPDNSAPVTPPPIPAATPAAPLPQAKPSANPPAKPASAASAESASRGTQRVQAGLDLIAQNKPVEARRVLSSALESSALSAVDVENVRVELGKLNQRLLFSAEVVSGDPFTQAYLIESGDVLAKLPRKLSLKTDWRFIQRINGGITPERIRVGQRIKVATGPFHAIVHKRDFRMDVFMGDGDDKVFVRSFTVGLGEFDGTPEGIFAVKPNSKLINPAWSNPRTGEHFEPNDPKNPLGEYWIGLIGVSENIRDLETYGIHGTIDPESIGKMKSMGCIRMLADDIALVYELMIENVSRVEIRSEGS